MEGRYLLPCSCGQEIPVEPRQAGQEIRCDCGASLEVPTMLGMAALEKAPSEPSHTPPSAPWGIRQGIVLLGTVTSPPHRRNDPPADPNPLAISKLATLARAAGGRPGSLGASRRPGLYRRGSPTSLADGRGPGHRRRRSRHDRGPAAARSKGRPLSPQHVIVLGRFRHVPPGEKPAAGGQQLQFE